MRSDERSDVANVHNFDHESLFMNAKEPVPLERDPLNRLSF